ncbi:MAG TPA: pitrilysin family protein [Candidatus Limnocylindria bacterium]|nr:pitrilysin family protein [Candidatus Limnocylindria bacterium]
MSARDVLNGTVKRGRLARVAAAVAVFATLAVAGPVTAGTLQLPPTTRATLENGLTVIVMPTQRLPLVDFRLVARAGAVDDPKGKEGLANLTADLLTQGAGSRNARQIAEEIAFVGGALESFSSSEQMVVTCEVLKKDFATGLELFRDVIAAPTFPAEEFERKRAETLGAIASQKDDPGTVANTALGPFLLGDSPLAHPAIGWEKSVTMITRDDVVAFHSRHLRPDHSLLAVVGDVDPKRVIAELERAFAGWKASGEKRGDAYQPVPQTKGREILIVNKPEVTQTQIRLACIGVPRNHPDYYPITVANTILGAGFTSRLVNEIRVNQGLTYSISSRFGMFRNAGTFGVNTFTKNETIRKTIDAAIGEIRKLAEQGPSDEELDKSKRYLTGQFPLGLQAPDALAAQILSVEFYGLEPDYLATFADKINAVTMADARRALKSYFCVDNLRILVVSNPEVAKKALQGLGPTAVREPL